MRVDITPFDVLAMLSTANDKGWPHNFVQIFDEHRLKAQVLPSTTLLWEVDSNAKPMDLQITLRDDGTWSATANLSLGPDEDEPPQPD